MDPYEKLASAIILLAVKDWRKAMSRLRKNPHNMDAQSVRGETERFFLSRWFGKLTELDGEVLLQKLKEEEDTNDD